MPKLTLHVDDELIAAAKVEAAERGTSVSKLVSDYFRVLSAHQKHETDESIGPITSSLAGILRDKSEISVHEDYLKHLEEKHA